MSTAKNSEQKPPASDQWKSTLSIGAMGLVLVVMLAMTFWNFLRFRDAAADVEHSQEIMLASSAMHENLNSMEMGMTAFLASGQKDLLKSVQQVETNFQGNLDNAQQLTAAIPEQQDRLLRFQKAHDLWVNDFLSELNSRMTAGIALDKGELRRLTGKGQGFLSTMRAGVEEFHTAATEQTRDEQERASSFLKLAEGALGASVLLIFIILGAMGFLLTGKTTELEGVRGQLAHEMAEHTHTVEFLQKTMEDSNAANLAKNEFLANMSHELRTPLNAIIGFAEILSEKTFGELNTRQERYVTNILTSGQNLLKLINNVLDLAKIEAGRIELESLPFNAAATIGDVVTFVKAQAIKKNITLTLDTEISEVTLNGDVAKFKQILHHIISNAVKFTPDGGNVCVAVTIRGTEGMTRLLRVAVTDSGIGIKPEDQARVFGEFTQIDSSYGRRQQGAGLGLALTKRFVELHGGRIWVESEGIEGKGSVFTVELPVSDQEKRPAVDVLMAENHAEGAHGSGPLVLVVENESDAQELLSVYLSEAGYQVKSAMDGVEAVEMARELRPHAIILDILLPRKDGWDVLTELKSQPETRSIPVVIVSMTENRELAYSLGAVDYFVKPAGRDELVAAVRKAMTVTGIKKSSEFTVLVVDDEPMNIELLIDVLHGLGCKVLLAYGGQQGIDVAISQLPDLIILDLMMPLVTGFDVVRELREHPQARQIPIMILTSKEITEEDRRQLNHVMAIVPRSGKEALLREMSRLGIANGHS